MIVVDRPFLFVLRNTELNITTLVGRVENPNIITSPSVNPLLPKRTQDNQDYIEMSKAMNVPKIDNKKIDNEDSQGNLPGTNINSSAADIAKKNTSILITTPKIGKYQIY